MFQGLGQYPMGLLPASIENLYENNYFILKKMEHYDSEQVPQQQTIAKKNIFKNYLYVMGQIKIKMRLEPEQQQKEE